MGFRKSVSFRPLLSGTWRAMEGERIGFAFFASLFVIAYSFDLLIPWAIGYTISAFVRLGFTPAAYHQAFIGIGAYVVLRLASIVLHHLGRYVQNSVAYSARMQSLEQVFTAIVRHHLNWHTRHHSGENLAKLNRSTSAVKSIVGQYCWEVLEGGVKVLLAGAALFALDFWVAVNIALMSALTLVIMALFNRRVTESLRVNNLFENRINRICLDYIGKISTVKALHLEDVAENYLLKQRQEGLTYTKNFSRYTEMKWASISIGYSFVMGSSLVIYFLARRNTTAALDVAEVYVMMSYLDKIFQSMMSFTSYFSGIIEACTAYEDATSLLVDKNLEKSELGEAAPLDWDHLRLEDLSFAYEHDLDEDEREVLAIPALDLSRGEHIALIGPSGCGKSTLLKILGGALQPASKLSVGCDGALLDLAQVTNRCLFIPQEPQVFAESLLYNITMGQQVDNAQLLNIISICRLNKLMQRLPHGWETNLAEDGLNLSGGERQRISIARALLRSEDKDIILLDEPTSSLDPKTERELLAGLFEFFEGRTVVSSCHRWNLLGMFDRVIQMDNGRIIRDGSPIRTSEEPVLPIELEIATVC